MFRSGIGSCVNGVHHPYERTTNPPVSRTLLTGNYKSYDSACGCDLIFLSRFHIMFDIDTDRAQCQTDTSRTLENAILGLVRGFSYLSELDHAFGGQAEDSIP